MKLLWMTILPVGMLLFSCNNRQYINTYVQRIEDLSDTLEADAAAFENMDTAEVSRALYYISNQLIVPDSAGNKTDSLNVQKFNNLQQNYKEFSETAPLLHQQLAYTRAQLANLKHDLLKEYLSAKEAALFFEQERQAVHVLRLKLDYYTRLIKTSQKKVLLIKSGLRNKADTLVK